MAIPKKDDSGFITACIKVEYEWKPPHCEECKVFGHDLISCPKCVKDAVRNDINMAAKASTTMDKTDDSFREVQNHKAKGKKVGVQYRRNSRFMELMLVKGLILGLLSISRCM